MERIVVDTNVLLRSLEPSNPACLAAKNALVTLAIKYSEVCVLPQNLIEFWNVATRPALNNGLGLEPSVVETGVSRFESIFVVLQDTQEIYIEWRSTVRDNAVLGKQVHDARIAAALKVHQVNKLLTFNGQDSNVLLMSKLLIRIRFWLPMKRKAQNNR